MRLTNGSAGEGSPFWSGDGKWLYFTSKPDGGIFQIWKTPASPGGAATQITRNGADLPFESRDGFLYYTKSGPSNTNSAVPESLWRMPSGGGEESQVLESLYWRAFFVVDNGIYFISTPRTPRAFSIQFLNFKTGATETIASVDGRPGEGMAVSPDGRFLLFSRSPEPESDLMLVENFR